MDFTIDLDTVAIAEAVLRFVEREVLLLQQQRHHDLLGSERTLFDASGRYVPEVLALRQQVRKRSAELGFYTHPFQGFFARACLSTRSVETWARAVAPRRRSLWVCRSWGRACGWQRAWDQRAEPAPAVAG